MSGTDVLNVLGILFGAWLWLMVMMFLLEWASTTR